MRNPMKTEQKLVSETSFSLVPPQTSEQDVDRFDPTSRSKRNLSVRLSGNLAKANAKLVLIISARCDTTKENTTLDAHTALAADLNVLP